MAGVPSSRVHCAFNEILWMGWMIDDVHTPFVRGGFKKKARHISMIVSVSTRIARMSGSAVLVVRTTLQRSLNTRECSS